ncbi:hypothetical protein ACP4OV_016138 [Aristida adscensionis]
MDDGAKAPGEEAAAPGGSGDANAAPPPPPRSLRRTLKYGDAAAVVDRDTKAADAGAAGGEEEEEEEDDDEQVERFYALLANIRAMRGAPHMDGGGVDDGGEADGGGGGGARKRVRGTAEPPWRPAFRPEDFEEPTPPTAAGVVGRRAKATRRGDEADGEESGEAGRRVVAREEDLTACRF